MWLTRRGRRSRRRTSVGATRIAPAAAVAAAVFLSPAAAVASPDAPDHTGLPLPPPPPPASVIYRFLPSSSLLASTLSTRHGLAACLCRRVDGRLCGGHVAQGRSLRVCLSWECTRLFPQWRLEALALDGDGVGEFGGGSASACRGLGPPLSDEWWERCHLGVQAGSRAAWCAALIAGTRACGPPCIVGVR